MTRDILNQLHAAVSDRLGVVADHALRDSDPAAHLQRLKAAAARLDSVVAMLPEGTDPELRHYFERQSYLKALAWLDKALEPDRQNPSASIPSNSEN